MERSKVLDQLKGGLVVSCQALPDEPLCSPFIMSRMAYAASLGGAVGIRANSVEDIEAIRQTVDLPIIGIIKRVYPDRPDVYITPTLREAEELARLGVEIIALDATSRPHPGGVDSRELLRAVRERFPGQLLMADCSTASEGLEAAELGFDLLGTTLCGYTAGTKDAALPNYAMIEALAKQSGRPVIAEGGIWTPGELRRVLDCGAFAAVVGTAITRPMEITRRFVAALSAGPTEN